VRPATPNGYLRPRLALYLWLYLVWAPWRYTYISARRDGYGRWAAARHWISDVLAGIRRLSIVLAEWRRWGGR
jgi:hypothetical protein